MHNVASSPLAASRTTGEPKHPVVADGEPREGKPKMSAHVASELGLTFETECIQRGILPPFSQQSHGESL